MDVLLETLKKSNEEAAGDDVGFTDVGGPSDTGGPAEESALYTTAVEDQDWLTEHADDCFAADDFPSSSEELNQKSEEELKKQLWIIQRELRKRQLRKSVFSAGDPAKRMAAARSLLSDAPIDFTKPTFKTSGSGGGTHNSQVHRGDTSSSEDELDRNKESDVLPILSDEGRAIKRRMAHQEAANRSCHVASLRHKAVDIGQKLTRDSPSVALVDPDAYDSFFGFKIRNPLVSSRCFQDYVGIRQKVKISCLGGRKDIDWNDWVTVGVLSEKSPCRLSAKGHNYVIWKLCDLLDNCHSCVKVFLFGDCVKSFATATVGFAFALLNATPLGQPDDKKKDTLTLKVDNARKLLELGSCPDFGVCKGKLARTGAACKNPVNRSKADYCDFHLASAIKKLTAKRGEFQLPFSAPVRRSRQPLVAPTPLGRNSVSRKSTISSAALLTRVRQSSQVLVITPRANVPNSSAVPSSNVHRPACSATAATTSESPLVDLMRIPSAGSKNLLKNLMSHSGDAGGGKAIAVNRKRPPPVQSCDEFLVSCKSSRPSLAAGPDSKPELGRGLKGKDVVFMTTSSCNGKKPVAALLRNKITSKEHTVRANILKKLQGKNKLSLPGDPSQSVPKKPRLGDIAMTKEQIAALANQTSNHEAELRVVDQQRERDYFKVMECKERNEQRLHEIMELKDCKVVTCKKCDYTWHSQSDLCKQLGHHVTHHTATKRFFKCRDCLTRFVLYQQFASKPCSKCMSTNIERVPMKEERKGLKMPHEEMKALAEGEFHEADF